MFRNPTGVAFSVLVLAGFGWVVFDQPLVPKLARIAAVVGLFLLASYGVDRLRERYGVDLPEE